MKMLKRVLLGLVPLVFLMLFAGVAVALPPRITWTPNPLVTNSISPGESVTYTVAFKNTGYLPIPVTNQLRIVPEGDIAKYVTVVPPKFPPVVKRGQSVTFGVVVTVPGDASVGVLDGTLVLQRVLPNGKVKEVWRAEGLPTSVAVVWPTFLGGEELGFALQYPPGWVVSTTSDSVSFQNSEQPLSYPDYSYIEIRRLEDMNPEDLPITDWLTNVWSAGFGVQISGTPLLLGSRDAVLIEGFNVRPEAVFFIQDSPDVIQVSCGLSVTNLVSECESMIDSLSFKE